MKSFVLTPFRWAVVLFFCVSCQTLFAQISKKKLDSLCMDPISFNLPDQSLGKEEFIYTPHFAFKIAGNPEEYAVVQLGRQRKAVPFIYIKLSPINSCVTNDDIVHLTLNDNSTIDLENLYDSNCDGLVVAEVDYRSLKILSEATITNVTVDTYKETYQLEISNYDAERIRYDLYCLEYKDF